MAANKEVRSTQFANKMIFKGRVLKVVTKSKSKHVHYKQKFIPQKLAIIIFGDPRNFILSKISCLTVYGEFSNPGVMLNCSMSL